MRIVSCLRLRGAIDDYTGTAGIIYAVEAQHLGQAYGHALLCAPQPGEVWPSGRNALGEHPTPVVLQNLHVLPSQRRSGIARALMRRCIEIADAKEWSMVMRVCSYSRGEKMDLQQLLTFYRGYDFLQDFVTPAGEPHLIRRAEWPKRYSQ